MANPALEADEPREVEGVLLAYLNQRSGAGDTLRGISQWWWERQTFEAAYHRIERALEALVQAGALAKRPLADGDNLFYVPARAEPKPEAPGNGEHDT